MSINIHTTKRFEVEYGPCATSGHDDTDAFIKYLQKHISQENSDTYISEDESHIEIPFVELEQMKDDPKWGATVQIILENSDRTNEYAVLYVW